MSISRLNATARDITIIWPSSANPSSASHYYEIEWRVGIMHPREKQRDQNFTMMDLGNNRMSSKLQRLQKQRLGM